MAKGPAPVDEERLPWLEPYRESVKARPAAAPTKRNSGRGVGLAIGGVAAVAAALTAGYWAGQRNAAPEPAPIEIAVTPAPIPLPAAPVATPLPAAPVPVAEAPPVAEPKKVAAATPRKQVRRSSPTRQRKIRSAGIESARLREVRAAQERAPALQLPAPRPTTARAWPKMPSPGPAGQVIQLGAFRHPSGANRAYRARLARYPVLSAMPRVVVPVATRPRGQVLYVLRLGTASRQQSAVVCRNLRASGDHCLVIG